LAEKQDQLLLLTSTPDQLASLIALVGEAGYALSQEETIELAQVSIDAGEIAMVILDGRTLGGNKKHGVILSPNYRPQSCP
jgi:hypothetical protein